MKRFKPGVYFKDGKQVFLNDKGEVENPRLYYMRTNGLEMYNKYVKPIFQIDFPSVLEPYTEARTKQIEGLQEVELEDITNVLVPMVSEEMKLKEIENKKKKFNHPDAVNKFGKNMTYYQYEQKVKEEEETKVEIKQDETDVNKAFTERTGIVIPESYK
tara:strand:- start:31 stop:507 length:477 start_codon:yes stop_codon:yes gene_type:complete